MAKRGGRRWFRWLLNLFSILSAISLLMAYLAPYIHPESFPLIPVFGLAYPLIILAFIGCMVLQVFFRRWWALSMLVLFLAGFGLHLRTYTFGGNEVKSNDVNSMKVMSYNVHLFDVYNSDTKQADETRREILSFLKKESPDVVCFQEFYQQDRPTNFVTKDSIIPLLGITDYQERYAHRRSGRRNFGIALFSKFPIIEKGEIRFDSDSDLKSFNFAIYSDIVRDKDTVRVYNVHLQSIKLSADDKAALASKESGTGFFHAMGKVMGAFPERAKQANRLMEHVRNSPFPVVICGDFNDTPLSYTYQRFHNELIDAWRNCRTGIGKTYAGKIPAGRIDYIFHSGSIGSYDFQLQEKALSDHYAISCKIFLKSK